MEPFFTNDAIVFGLLCLVLAGVFITSNSDHKGWRTFYRFVPPLFLCYFIPAILRWPLGLVSGDYSQTYFVASRYLLPASLIYLCLGIDLKGILNLGSKTLIMFLTASLGIIIGGPIALFTVIEFFPGLIDAETDELWRGLSTVAGSWIGGGANQTAMREIFEVSDEIFGTMVTVDIVVANIWLGFLLYGANIAEKVDRWLKADTSMIEDLKVKVQEYQKGIQKIPETLDLYKLLGVGIWRNRTGTLGSRCNRS